MEHDDIRELARWQGRVDQELAGYRGEMSAIRSEQSAMRATLGTVREDLRDLAQAFNTFNTQAKAEREDARQASARRWTRTEIVIGSTIGILMFLLVLSANLYAIFHG